VDIAFHETAGLAAGGRRSVTFTDNLGFIVGTLGEEGGMFATDLVEDDDEYYDGEDEDNFAGLGVMSAIARKEGDEAVEEGEEEGGRWRRRGQLRLLLQVRDVRQERRQGLGHGVARRGAGFGMRHRWRLGLGHYQVSATSCDYFVSLRQDSRRMV